MPTPKKGARLGGSPAHQRLIIANLATQLFEHGRITKIGPRKGDNAPMAVIELVTEAYSPKAPSTRTKSAPATAAPVEMTEEASPEVSVVAEADLETVVEVEGVETDAFEETEGGTAGKYDGSSVPLEDADTAPEGFPIKGNEGSMKYHTPDGQWFDQTTAEVWFDTEESAQSAGFTKAGE